MFKAIYRLLKFGILILLLVSGIPSHAQEEQPRRKGLQRPTLIQRPAIKETLERAVEQPVEKKPVKGKVEELERKAAQPTGIVTFDAKDADIKDVLRAMGEQQGINIVCDKSVEGTITLHLTEVPFEDALRAILFAYGFTYRKKGEIYFVSKAGEGEVLAVQVTEVPQKLLTIDVKDADLGEVVRAIATEGEIDFITFGTVREKIDIHLTNIPLEEGLRQIFSGTKYTFNKVGDVYLIGDSSLTTPAAPVLTAPKLLRLNYLDPDEALKLLPASIPSANIKVMKEQNAFLVTGPEEIIERVKTFISEIDHPPPQIMVEAIIVEFSTSASLELGLSGGYGEKKWEFRLFPAGGASTLGYSSVGILSKEYWATLNALVSEGKAKIRARPRITTISGKKATIEVSETRYYEVTEITADGLYVTQLHTVDFGISLDVTPWVGEAKEITLEINPKISTLVGIGADGLPEIGKRSAQTTVRVQDGETIVLGGLIQTSKTESVDKIPGLGKIPYLGRLFSKTIETETESELVIYITPHLMPIATEEKRRKIEENLARAEAEVASRKIIVGEMEEEAKLHFHLGKRFYKKSKFSKALEEFNKAQSLDPELKRIGKHIVKARMKLWKLELKEAREAEKRGNGETGKRGNGATEREEVVEEEPAEIVKRYNRGREYYKNDKFLFAILEFDEVLKLDAQHGGANKYIREASAKLARLHRGEEKARQRMEEEAKKEKERKIEEKAKRTAQVKAKLRAEEEAQREAELKAKEEDEKEARKIGEAESREQERLAREEAGRRIAEIERAAQLEAQLQAQEEAKKETELKAKREEEREARRAEERKAREEAKRAVQVEARLKAEEETQRKAELKAKKEEEKEARKIGEAERREQERLAREEAGRRIAEVDRVAQLEARLQAREEAQKEAELKAKIEEAKKIAREKARAKQQEIKAQYKLARTYYKNKKNQEAIEEFEKVLALHPEHRRTRWYIARSQGRIVRAEERARIRVKKKGKAEGHFRAGKNKYLFGDLEGAIDELRTALTLDPVHQGAGELLTIIVQGEKK